MGKGVVYCTKCGERLLEEDFQKNKAFMVLNTCACAKCYNAVIASLTPQERAQLEQQEQQPPTSTKLRAQTSRLVKKPGTTYRVVSAASPAAKKSPTVVLIIAGIGTVVGLGLIAVLMTTGGTGTGTIVDDKNQKRNEAARKLVEELKGLAAQGSDLEAVANQAGSIRDKVARTPYEEEVSEIESAFRILHQRRTNVRAKIQEYIDEAKRFSKNYTDFKEHLSVLERFDRAASLAKDDLRQRDWFIKLKDETMLVEKELAAYQDAFAAAAKRAFDEAVKEAERLIETKEYTDAIKVLTNYPEEFQKTEWPQRLQEKVDLIRREYLKVGEWVPLFDGKSLNGWERLASDKGIKDNNWQVLNGALVGTSSFEKGEPGVTYSDLLYYDADEFDDFEVRITCIVEGGGGDANKLRTGMKLLLRAVVSGGRAESALIVNIHTHGGRGTATVTVSKGTCSIDGGTGPRTHDIPPQAAPRGKIALALSPGVKAKIETFRIKRLK